MAEGMFHTSARGLLPLNEARVVFLGDQGVGKSYTLSRLLNDGAEPLDYTDTPTMGISIKNKEFNLDGRKVKLNFWDFGGQDIFHTIYRMFLTERTLYVVMLNSTDEGLNDRARYWLSTIGCYAKDAPVILVLNKADQNPIAAINEPDIKQLFPNLKQVVRMSALRDDQKRFNNSIRDTMLDAVQSKGWLDTFWPVTWVNIRQVLAQMDADYISISDFMKLCETYHVTVDQEALLRWLNNCGIIFYGFDVDLRVILRPEWIVNALAMILFDDLEGIQNGFVSRDSVYSLLEKSHRNPNSNCSYSGSRYDRQGDIPYILYIVTKHYFAVEGPDNRLFIPARCDRTAKPIAWEYGEDESILEVYMEFDYLPSTVMHQLIIERRLELDTANVWYSGARFVQKENSLSAVVMTDRNILHFFVQSTDSAYQPYLYLCELKSTADSIWKQMKLQEPVSQVVYKDGGISEPFDYRMLTEMLDSGEKYIYSARRRKKIRIENILNRSIQENGPQMAVLLRDIGNACESIQNQAFFKNRSEADRNLLLRMHLRSSGYAMTAPSMTGADGGANRPDGLDLVLLDETEKHMTMIEALNIQSVSTPVRYWDHHLSKLLYYYHSGGLPVLFLISYVQCSQMEYNSLWARYSDHMRWYSPERCEQVTGSYQQIDLQQNSNPYLRIGKCSYHVGGRTVTVYHYFVGFVGEGSDVSAPVKPQVEPPQKPFFEKFRELQEKGGEPPVEKPEQKKSVAPTPPAEETALLEYRVVLLGDSEAGKSLILARLKDPRMDPAAFSGDTTAGIDIYSRIEDIGGRRVRVNYWDFGGQEILHSMHRMFLSNQTLYVIVLNTRNDNQDAQAGFWIRYVQTYAPGAPLLLVMNKIDQNPRATLNLPVLCRQLNRKLDPADLLKLCAVEKDPKAFAGAFTEKLMERIRQSIHGAREFTATQAKIRDLVEEKKKKCQVISCDDFLDICDNAGLKEQREQEALMNRFHEAGIMVFFGEGKPMLLNPEWITTAIYKVLEKRDEIAGNGIVPHTKLRKLFRRELGDAYSSDDAEAVLKVMRAYGMSFPCEEAVPGVSGSENKEFIPMLCQREEPPQIEDLTLADGTIELQMIFEYLPGGVFHQLMVDHQDILDKEHAWLSGAIFRSGGDYAIVRRDGNVLSIYVHHRHKVEAANWLFALAEQVKVIAKRTKYRAEIYEMRIGFRIADVMEYFDYDRLLSAKACQLHYVASKVNRQPVAVRDILEQDDRSAERDRNELLRLTLVGCMDLQKDEVFWNTDENTKNRQLARTLRQRFTVLDQTQGGLSESGSSSGELDIEIRKGKDMPIAILEALKTTSIRTKNWREHLDKLMDNYNTSGLRYLILTSYVGGPKHLFGKKCAEAAAEWKQEPESFQGCLENFDTVLLNDRPELVHITRADYIRNHFRVSLYHFMVHISENKTAKQS